MSAAATLEVWLEKQFPRSDAGSFSLSLTFHAAPGVTILFGPSGAGKTTTLRCLAGLLAPERGRIRLGEDVWFDSVAKVNLPPQARRVGCVFQKPTLFPHLTVAENVGYGLRRWTKAARRARVQQLLEAFRIGHLAHRLPREISGGEYQRATLARALAIEPNLLLLDEPLTALDDSIRAEILADLRRWNHQHRIPILYVTHDRDEALQVGEHVLLLRDGRLLASGRPEVLLAPARSASPEERDNVFDATPVARDEAAGLLLCRLDPAGVFVEVPLPVQPCESLQLAISPRDLLLATQPPVVSTCNVLVGKILQVSQTPAHVCVRVEAGACWEVQVPAVRGAEMQLSVGQTVWLILPPHCCRVRIGRPRVGGELP